METAARLSMAVGAGLLLMGCDGASSGDGDNAPRATYAELAAEADAFEREVVPLDNTEGATLPTAGSSTYEGVVTFGEVFRSMPAMAGEITLEVDFEDSSLSGTAENFVTEDEEEVSGSLDIEDGRVYRESNLIDGNNALGAFVSGRLEVGDGAAYDFNGGLQGELLGDDHTHASGTLEGGLLTPEGPNSFFGQFTAER